MLHTSVERRVVVLEHIHAKYDNFSAAVLSAGKDHSAENHMFLNAETLGYSLFFSQPDLMSSESRLFYLTPTLSSSHCGSSAMNLTTRGK